MADSYQLSTAPEHPAYTLRRTALRRVPIPGATHRISFQRGFPLRFISGWFGIPLSK
ncbi:hypothetical protein HOF92_02070 [bacterium]|nr:hypothetical protein [bacterium]